MEKYAPRAEEIASSISHGVGLVAAVAAVPILVVTSVGRGSGAAVVGAAIFGATVVALYLTSTLYHALPESGAKRVFRVLDHGAIFLLIAGTYTPFTLGVLGGAWGWALFGVVWGLALAGIALKVVCGMRHPALSMWASPDLADTFETQIMGREVLHEYTKEVQSRVQDRSRSVGGRGRALAGAGGTRS